MSTDPSISRDPSFLRMTRVLTGDEAWMATGVRGLLRTEQRFAAVLALTAGFVDAYGLISYQTYLSFMSGNTKQTGSQIGQSHVAGAMPSLTAIVFFVLGVFSGSLLVHSGLPNFRRALFGVVAALIAVIMFVSLLQAPNPFVSIAVISLAMGILNTSLSRVGAQAVNIGFVTGTLNKIADHLAMAVKRVPLADAEGPWDTQLRRAMVLFGVSGVPGRGAAVGICDVARWGEGVGVPTLPTGYPDRAGAGQGH
jgi:uncharacterized membrane protein YoaK (UPF0700 family)